MSETERFGTRSLEYSAWHRTESLKRYLPVHLAHAVAMIDIDRLYVEYIRNAYRPLLLVEEAKDIGRNGKAATVTRELARFANIPAACVLWTPSGYPNPADPTCQDIASFRYRRIYPHEELTFHDLTPEQFAERLLRLRKYGEVHGGPGRGSLHKKLRRPG